MNLVDFAILCLATWRISSLLVDETGPFDMFLKLRELVGITHDEYKRVAEIPDRFLPQLLSCMWCTSVWVGFTVSVFYFLLGGVSFWMLFPLTLALSAGAIMLSSSIR